jgi:hypothetical protein
MATSTVNQVLTGFDATILIEGQPVGRGTSFTVKVAQNLEEVYEQGTRKAVEVKEKKFSVTGEVKRYYINQDLVKRMLGGTNTFGESLPYFTIKGFLKNPADGSVKSITVQSVKFGGWDIAAAHEANIEETLPFTALNVIVD